MLLGSRTPKKVCYLSTYPPRKCGIGVFTKDLVDAIDLYSDSVSSTVIAVNENSASHRYDERVKWQIMHNNEEDFMLKGAPTLFLLGIDCCISWITVSNVISKLWKEA